MLGISLLFFTMIRGFVITVLLAAVFTAVSRPIYLRLLRRFGDRRKLASVTTLLILLVVFVGPAIAFLGLVVSQAVEVSQAAGPWIRENADLIGLLRERAEAIPFVSDMLPERDQIAGTVGQLIQDHGRSPHRKRPIGHARDGQLPAPALRDAVRPCSSF